MLAGVNLRLPPDKLFFGRAVPFLPGLRSSTLNLGRHKTRALGKEMLPSKLIRLLLVVFFFASSSLANHWQVKAWQLMPRWQ